MIIENCILALGDDWRNLYTIAYYSHLVPIFLSLFLSIYSVVKTKYSQLSIAFLFFSIAFSLWLMGDLVTWVSSNSSWIYLTWSWLDYINIIFFVTGAYFFALLSREKVNTLEKVFFILLCIPAFYITLTGNSVVDFYEPVCEASNNSFLTEYKLVVEAIATLMILIYIFMVWRKSDNNKRIQLTTVLASMLFFFAVFGLSEYVASISGIYEINLYGLFVLPVFLIAMVFSITNLGLFQFRFLGSQISAYILIIMVGSQFLFIQDSTDRNLNIITFAIALFLTYLLLQNAKKEAEQRERIEILNTDLEKANEGQMNLIHIINHQIKGYLAKSRNIFSELLGNQSYGPIPEKSKPMMEEGFKSLTEGVAYVQKILTSSNADRGTLTYSMTGLNFKDLVTEVVEKQKERAEKKGLVLTLEAENGDFNINGDGAQLKEAVRDLLDNSIIYTEKGSVSVNLSKSTGKIVLRISDTGIGIAEDDKKRLFTKGGKGKDSSKINVNSSGFGLAFVKGVIEAHKGKVSAESDGPGKGSTFTLELPA